MVLDVYLIRLEGLSSGLSIRRLRRSGDVRIRLAISRGSDLMVGALSILRVIGDDRIVCPTSLFSEWDMVPLLDGLNIAGNASVFSFRKVGRFFDRSSGICSSSSSESKEMISGTLFAGNWRSLCSELISASFLTAKCAPGTVF